MVVYRGHISEKRFSLTACRQEAFAHTHCRSVARTWSNGLMKQQQEVVFAVQCSAFCVYTSRHPAMSGRTGRRRQPAGSSRVQAQADEELSDECVTAIDIVAVSVAGRHESFRCRRSGSRRESRASRTTGAVLSRTQNIWHYRRRGGELSSLDFGITESPYYAKRTRDYRRLSFFSQSYQEDSWGIETIVTTSS